MEKKMEFGSPKKNILILSSPNPNKTAGIVAKSIYEELKLNTNNHVSMIVKEWDEYDDENIIPINSFYKSKYLSFLNKIRYKLIKLGLLDNKTILTEEKYSVQDYYQTNTIYNTKKILSKINFKPDIVLVLFMQNFISYKNLYEINKITNGKIYLYLMDMAPLTGACHYAWNCTNYINECGNCPALISNVKNDQSRINLKFKKEFIDKTNIEILLCSDYTKKQAEISSIFKSKKISKVYLPIENFPFEIIEKNKSRVFLNLPTDKKIIFFGANSINNERKGYKYLLEALEILSGNLSKVEKDNIHLAIAGNNEQELPEKIDFKYTYLGFLNHQNLKIAFASADFFVSPSIEDSGPMMINQSLVRGTPIVSFKMGVALDLIRSGENGFLAELGDSIDLANCIHKLLALDNNQLCEMNKKCIETANEYCTIQKQVKEIYNLFK
jgi:glycosyltransferase involved in cell wall biosynthesis